MIFGSDSTDKLKIGITKLAKAVKSTMGPNGNNVIISRDNSVAITKDGVTVAREVDLEDYLENVGAQMVKQIAHKTAVEAGDGTTTATVLAESIFINGLKQIELGANISDLQKGMAKRAAQVIENLKQQAITVDNNDQIKNVATISANNDTEIGELLAAAFGEVGFSGLITMGPSATHETHIEIVPGMQVSGGWFSPFFSKSGQPVIEFEKPIIILYEGRIVSLAQIIKLLDYINRQRRPFVIMCDNIDVDALNMILTNVNKGLLNGVVVKAPSLADTRFAILEDVAVVTGATVITPRNQVDIDELTNDETCQMYEGGCLKVKVTGNHTQFIEGIGQQEKIDARKAEVEELLLNDELTPSAQLILKERIAKLDKGVATIMVGANSELELKEKVDRIEDALGATYAAIAEGIVSGGGMALYYAATAHNLNVVIESPGEKAGAEVINQACLSPFRTIVENSGKNFEIILRDLELAHGQEQYQTADNYNPLHIGYDAKQDRMTNLIKDGIIDPVKVTRLALENSLSVISLMLKTSTMMVKKPIDIGI